MMVEEQHYDDDTLFALLFEDGGDADHLGACTECREKLDAYRLIAGALREEATWDERPLDETPNPRTIAALRNFADQMAAEDADAALYLQDLLEGPRESWMDNLRQHPELRTAGVVRKLIEAAPAALDAMPRDAVELTALATEIADHLDPCIGPPDTVSRLRGAAWRERAYALFYTGDFANAERALCASESHFTESCVNEYDLARVGIVRALVERGLENYSKAIGYARESARQFRRFNDQTRSAAAGLAEANLLFSCNEYAAAYKSLITLKNNLERSDDSDTYARVLGNLGFTCWKLARNAEALEYLDAAAQLFEEIGVRTDAVRVRWNAARVLAGEGRLADALPRFRFVAAEFDRLGMKATATQAQLEIAELLVTTDAFDEVEEICRTVIRRFEGSSLQHTAPALTALALMQEAVRNRTATEKLVVHVREYLRRVPDEPHLLFAYPPE